MTTGYELIKRFYDRVAELSDMQTNCKPHHLALYTWVCELHNRTRRQVMDLPRDYTMSMSFIGSATTFKTALDDLEKWGLITIIQRGSNQWQTTKVQFACTESYKQNTGNVPAQDEHDTSNEPALEPALYTTKTDKTIQTVETRETVKTDIVGSDEPEVSVKAEPSKGKVKQVIYTPQFEEFWKLYAKPSASKKEAYQEWGKLTPTEQQSAIGKLGAYIAHQPEAKYRKDPNRFLKHRTWENDFNPVPTTVPINGHPLLPLPTAKRPQAATNIR